MSRALRIARAKTSEEWNHTADLMAHMRNLQRTDDREKWWTRADYHPFLEKPRIPRINDPSELV